MYFTFPPGRVKEESAETETQKQLKENDEGGGSGSGTAVGASGSGSRTELGDVGGEKQFIIKLPTKAQGPEDLITAIEDHLGTNL